MANSFIKIAGLRVKLADLSRRYDLSKARSEKWELVLNEITSEAMEKLMEIISVQDICWKIYNNMCERKNLHPVYENDYENQFNFIKKMLYQYECVNQLIQKTDIENLKISEKACISGKINDQNLNDVEL